MSIAVEGTIQQVEFGPGAWSLIAVQGTTYELYEEVPTPLQQPGLRVKIQGQIREDVMTLAMIGPVLEVQSFEILSGK